jgi:hypothetical protein
MNGEPILVLWRFYRALRRHPSACSFGPSDRGAGVNLLQVQTNYEIGRRIVEHEQGGADRAQYGKEVKGTG